MNLCERNYSFYVTASGHLINICSRRYIYIFNLYIFPRPLSLRNSCSCHHVTQSHTWSREKTGMSDARSVVVLEQRSFQPSERSKKPLRDRKKSLTLPPQRKSANMSDVQTGGEINRCVSRLQMRRWTWQMKFSHVIG